MHTVELRAELAAELVQLLDCRGAGLLEADMGCGNLLVDVGQQIGQVLIEAIKRLLAFVRELLREDADDFSTACTEPGSRCSISVAVRSATALAAVDCASPRSSRG